MSMKKIIYLFSILYILSIVFCASIASASWNAYIMGPGVKYRPWDTVPTNTSLNVNAVRGQWASFQIACRVSNEDVSGVDVSVTTPTMGTNTLSPPIIYKEITYNIIKKSRDDGAIGSGQILLFQRLIHFILKKEMLFLLL